jgi:hypothetical protein
MSPFKPARTVIFNKKLLLSYSPLFVNITIFYYDNFRKLLLHLGPLLPWKILLLYPTKNIFSPPSAASFSQKNVINQSMTLKKINPLHVTF